MTSKARARRFFGLVSRRERWGLSGRGWGALAGSVVLACWGFVAGIHSFLAVTAPVDSPVVAVEAWVPPAILKGVADHYKGDGTRIFYCAGGPSDEHFDSTRIEDTSAAEAARGLRRFGIAESQIRIVPTRVPRRDRTYSNAVALRDWFRENGIAVPALTVVTEGIHARRSRLMFEKAFGPSVPIGVIAIPDPTYDASHWWRYSEGIKAVISETAGYLYVRTVF